MVNKYTVDHHQSLRINVKGVPSYFYGFLRSLSHSKISLEFFLKPVYPTLVGEKFQIYGVKIIEKGICQSKNWICLFLLMPPSKTLHQVIIVTL